MVLEGVLKGLKGFGWAEKITWTDFSKNLKEEKIKEA